MRRHIPTLASHPERESSGADDNVENLQWASPSLHRQQSYGPTTGMTSMKSRMKQRSPPAFSTSPAARIPAPITQTGASSSKYSDIYSQFVKRYRSRPGAFYDARDDPENSAFRGGPGQLIDDDSDGERPRSSQGTDNRDRYGPAALDNEVFEPASAEERERLEWQSMLASVLDGDVLRSEKSRIQVALMNSAEGGNSRHLDTWIGLRAKLRGRSVEEERKLLEERKLHLVDRVIGEILQFRVNEGPAYPSAFRQVSVALEHLDKIQSFYPHLKAFYLDKPLATTGDFQARCDTLITWFTVRSSLRQQIDLLCKWTGSETLDVTARSMSPEHDGSSFVERLHKEETLQRTFEKGFLTTVHALIGSARDTQVNLAPMFQVLNLPTFEEELVQLISFPTRLIHASLHVRLDYANRVKEPDVLVIEQMLEDFRLSIGLACTLKRQYEAFLQPDPGGNWNLPSCISEDYDQVVLEALSVFFKFINYKLKSGSKDIYFRETEVLEGQWTTFNDVSLIIKGGASLVAEQLCSITNKLMVRATNNFERQIRIPILGVGKEKSKAFFTPPHASNSPSGVNGLGFDFQRSVTDGKGRLMTGEQMIGWYEKVLESVKARYRKLQRFSRALSQRFGNSAEYTLENVQMDSFVASLVETDHFLVYTQTFEEEGTYIVASRGLRDRPEIIEQILQNPFHVNEIWKDGYRSSRRPTALEPDADIEEEVYDDSAYLLVLSPRVRFLWNGLVLMLPLTHVDFELKDNRVRLVADGAHTRLTVAKELFGEVFLPIGEDGEPLESYLPPLTCVVDQMAHLPAVNRELRKISRVTNRLAEAIVEAVHYIRKSLRGVSYCTDLLESWYSFASEHGQHAQRYMDRPSWLRFNRLLIRLAISWVSFICDDCDPTDRKTFRWAVSALEFALLRTKRNNILHLPDDQFEMLRQKVASCMTLLISHFDILGARSALDAEREKERQEGLRQLGIEGNHATDNEEDFWEPSTPANEGVYEEKSPASVVSTGDRSVRRFREEVLSQLRALEDKRAGVGSEQHMVGRVLDDQKPEDQSLMFLASATSNVSIRWQQGKFIGAGAFGSVYTAVNLDTGSVMAVKEIRVQDVSGTPNLYKQIQDELRVMEMLHHPNIVEFYGIEVHRDKVYIFEEYCEGGSLAANLEVGRIADENILQIYTMQMLEGLSYLHSRGIVHRDIKPDNILLDHMGVLKFVDFGAAKIIAKNTRTWQRSRISNSTSNGSSMNIAGGVGAFDGGLGKNSLTGTPMYMSPEVIKNDRRGRHGAMDIWSLGCVVLECATGRKPWSNLDNEWAIMFHIGVATQHPPLPDNGELSVLGIDFIKQCLTIDALHRPSADELMNHAWMLQLMETIRNYEEEELATSPPVEMPSEHDFEGATIARQAAILKEKEVETINSGSPSITTPESDITFSLKNGASLS